MDHHLLLADGEFESVPLAEDFSRQSRDIEKWISTFVHKKIQKFGNIETS